MIKLLSISFALLFGASKTNNTFMNKEVSPSATVYSKSIYDFKVEALDGTTIDFA